MGRFDKVWSETLKRGLVAAICDRGLTAPQAVQLAMSGRLPHPDEPDEMLDAPKRQGMRRERVGELLLPNARAWASAERNARRGENVPAWILEKGDVAAIDKLTTRLIAIAAGEVQALEKMRPEKRDLDRGRKAAQMLREAQALTQKQAPTRSSAMRDAANGKPSTEKDTAEAGAANAIAAMHETRRGEMPRRDDPKGQGEDGDETQTRTGASDQHEDRDETEGQSGGGILRSARDERGSDRGRAAAELGIRSQ